MKPEIDVKVGLKDGGWLGAVFNSLSADTRSGITALVVFFGLLFGLQLITRAPSKCWELQFKDDRVFRVNGCTGQVVELDKKTLEPLARPQ